MIKKILIGYKDLLLTIVKISCLLLLCVGFAFLVVWPLWKFATIYPVFYTITVAVVSIILIGVLVSLKIRSFLFASNISFEEKTSRKKAVKKILFRIFTIIIGLFFVCFFVLLQKRILALFIFIITIALYGIFSFGANNNDSNKN